MIAGRSDDRFSRLSPSPSYHAAFTVAPAVQIGVQRARARLRFGESGRAEPRRLHSRCCAEKWRPRGPAGEFRARGSLAPRLSALGLLQPANSSATHCTSPCKSMAGISASNSLLSLLVKKERRNDGADVAISSRDGRVSSASRPIVSKTLQTVPVLDSCPAHTARLVSSSLPSVLLF